jgi:hypothetical protein
MIQVVLPLVTNTVDAILNPFSQRNVSLLVQLIEQILDFDPPHAELAPLLDQIILKFERSLELSASSPTSLSQLQQLNILLQNLQKLSQFLSPQKVRSIAWACLQKNQILLLNVLERSTDTLQEQINAYNLTVFFCQIVFNLLQTVHQSKENNGSAEFPHALYISMKGLVLDQVDISVVENLAKQLSLFQFRRSSLVYFIRQISVA